MAAILLVPYATTRLPFRLALGAQAVAISLLTLALAWPLVTRNGRRRLVRAPRLSLTAVVLFAGATLLGTVVALVAGHPLGRIAGQTLAMGLLPLGAVALSAHGGGREPAVAHGVVLGVVGAVLVHLVDWTWRLGSGQPIGYHYLGNAVSISAAAPLGLVLAVALGLGSFREAETHRRGASWLVGAGLVLVFVLGSGARGLWIASAIALLALAAVSPGIRSVLASRRVLGALAAVLVAALALAAWQGTRMRRNLLAGPDGPDRPRAPLCRDAGPAERLHTVAELPGTPGTYRLTARVWSASPPDTGFGRLQLEWLDADGVPRGGIAHRVDAGEPGRPVELFASSTADTDTLRIGLRTPPAGESGEGAWCVRDLRLHRVGPRLPEPALRQAVYLWRRTESLLAVLRGSGDTPEDGIAFRIAESRKLARQIAAGSPRQWLVGRGLGATFEFDGWGFDNQGRRTYYEDVHYIHDYYLFLLYKLGALGTLAVLVALGLWTACAWARRRRSGPPTSREIAAATVAAMAAAAIWSLTSPVWLDFRLAPVWGMLLAATAGDHEPEIED